MSGGFGVVPKAAKTSVCAAVSKSAARGYDLKQKGVGSNGKKESKTPEKPSTENLGKTTATLYL